VIAHWSVPSGWPVVTASGVDRDWTLRATLEIVSHGGDVRLLAALPAPIRKDIVKRLLARATTWRFVSTGLLEKLAAAIDHQDVPRLRRHLLGNRPLFVCAGRLVRSKRVDRVIDYVAGQRAIAPMLVVIGDGPERARLEKLATEWKIDVRFLGNTPRRETLTWIGAADELVHASIAEGMSTVVREAEYLGVKITML
jgi:glycosyltransferase involved in cell wall biosynthesis